MNSSIFATILNILLMTSLLSCSANKTTSDESEIQWKRFEHEYASLKKGCSIETFKHDFQPFPAEIKSDFLVIKQPSAILINLASSHFCLEILKILSEKISAEEFANGVTERHKNLFINEKFSNEPLTFTSFLELSLTIVENIEDINNDIDPEYENFFPTIKFIQESLSKNCDQYSGISCEAVNKFKDTKEKMKKIFTQKEFDSSPKGQAKTLLENACKSYQEIISYQSLINEEREKGKVSGYVDITKLKTWGDALYQSKKDLKEYSNAYKSILKKGIYYQKQCESL